MAHDERIDGIPTVWNARLRDQDFCTDARCTATRDFLLGQEIRSRSKSRSRRFETRDTDADARAFVGSLTSTETHWRAHLMRVLEAHRGEVEYVPDTSRRPIVRDCVTIRPVKPRLRGAKRTESPKKAERKMPDVDIQTIIARKNARLADDRARNPRKLSDVRDVTKLTNGQARDVALTILDDRETARTLSARSGDALDRAFRDNTLIARRACATETDAYRRAFRKALHGGGSRNIYFDDEESAALNAAWEWRKAEARAQNEGTSASGGYAVPPTVDPSVVFTDAENQNDFWQLARVVDIDSNEYRGVTSAVAAWGFKAEGVETADVSLTSMSQPSIPVHALMGSVKYSIEISQDWPGFAAEFVRVLSVGYNELALSKFTSGSGTGEPTGLLTALSAATPTTLITSTTDGAFGEPDVFNVWNALPEKSHRNSTWMVSASVMSRVRGMSFYHASMVPIDNRVNSYEVLFSRQIVENNYFPAWSSTTGASTRLVLGDFSRYVVARRVGMTVEPVGLVPSTSNNRPSGERAFLAYARLGGDCVDPQAFRYQANT